MNRPPNTDLRPKPDYGEILSEIFLYWKLFLCVKISYLIHIQIIYLHVGNKYWLNYLLFLIKSNPGDQINRQLSSLFVLKIANYFVIQWMNYVLIKWKGVQILKIDFWKIFYQLINMSINNLNHNHVLPSILRFIITYRMATLSNGNKTIWLYAFIIKLIKKMLKDFPILFA